MDYKKTLFYIIFFPVSISSDITSSLEFTTTELGIDYQFKKFLIFVFLSKNKNFLHLSYIIIQNDKFSLYLFTVISNVL